MSKPRKSRLDAHAEALLDWDAQHLTLAEMQKRLAERGCRVSLARISTWLERARREKLTRDVLRDVYSGAKLARELEGAFQKNPAPELRTLVGLLKRIIFSLSVQASADPTLLQIANDTLRAMVQLLRVQQSEEALAFEREKFQRQTAEAVLRAAQDAEVARIASSNAGAAEKIEAIGRHLFGDLWNAPK
jgi:hypothetical protein